METVTIGDALIHYQNKFLELEDSAEDLCTRLKTAQALAESDWHGTAGQAAYEKINELSSLMSQVLQYVSEATGLLSGISAAVEEEAAAAAEAAASSEEVVAAE